MHYWDEGGCSDSWPNIVTFIEIARKIKSLFFTMDIGQTEDGYWKIIELGFVYRSVGVFFSKLIINKSDIQVSVNEPNITSFCQFIML